MELKGWFSVTWDDGIKVFGLEDLVVLLSPDSISELEANGVVEPYIVSFLESSPKLVTHGSIEGTNTHPFDVSEEEVSSMIEDETSKTFWQLGLLGVV